MEDEDLLHSKINLLSQNIEESLVIEAGHSPSTQKKNAEIVNSEKETSPPSSDFNENLLPAKLDSEPNSIPTIPFSMLATASAFEINESIHINPATIENPSLQSNNNNHPSLLVNEEVPSLIHEIPSPIENESLEKKPSPKNQSFIEQNPPMPSSIPNQNHLPSMIQNNPPDSLIPEPAPIQNPVLQKDIPSNLPSSIPIKPQILPPTSYIPFPDLSKPNPNNTANLPFNSLSSLPRPSEIMNQKKSNILPPSTPINNIIPKPPCHYPAPSPMIVLDHHSNTSNPTFPIVEKSNETSNSNLNINTPTNYNPEIKPPSSYNPNISAPKSYNPNANAPTSCNPNVKAPTNYMPYGNTKISLSQLPQSNILTPNLPQGINPNNFVPYNPSAFSPYNYTPQFQKPNEPNHSYPIPQPSSNYTPPNSTPKISQFPQEDYIELLKYGLSLKNANQDYIDDLVFCCYSKKDALMFLDIPTNYYDLPISKSRDYLEKRDPLFNSKTIKSELIKNGINSETAKMLSKNFTSLEEAKLNLNIQPTNSSVIHSYPNEMVQAHNDVDDPNIKDEYFDKLKDYRLTISEDREVFNNFSILDKVSGCDFSLKRINTEIKAISTLAPCLPNESIFVLFDNENNHRVKFLISGSYRTPYSHGLYLFDVLLPLSYPLVPPKVNFVTNSREIIRFNPNIHPDGKVCLSIIGTYEGNPEEQWNPSSTSMLQVMIAIQNWVMSNDILQKEPLFDFLPTDAPENTAYQTEVKYLNMKYAMIEHLKNPPRGFENVIKSHFKIKTKEILQTTSRWVKEAKDFKDTHNTMQNVKIAEILNREGPGRAFENLYNQLEVLLKNL